MKAVIARSDLLTAYGWGMAPLWAGLMAGQTAITSQPRFNRRETAHYPVAMVRDLDVPHGTSRARAMLDRLLFPLIGRLDPQTPVILATTVCEIEFVESAVLENDANLSGKASPLALLGHITALLGLEGASMVLSSACASSAAALCRAALIIERGTAPAVLVITADAISEFVYAGFSTLLSLCDQPARPFDAHHCGLSLGEAAAWALVTGVGSTLATPDSPVVLGWSSTSDAIHMTAPDRAAGGLTRAISHACQMAGIEPKQIGMIAAHGTATLYNDAMELLAFRSAVPNPIPAFSIKGGTGHALAAAGLVQILVACEAMKVGKLPGTVGLSTPEDNAVGWVSKTSIDLLQSNIFLSTNSGFGGVNTAVIIGNEHGQATKAGSQNASKIISQTVPRPSSPGRQTASIVSIAWFATNNCGSLASNGTRVFQPSPPLSDTRNMTAIIGRSPKYFPRLTDETRMTLAAANLAMKAADWPGEEIGIVGAGYEGWLKADEDYFRDYVAQGRSLGRANLFIRTLPTSAMSEIAIALNLTGPTLHVQAKTNPIQALIQQAIAIVENEEAAGILCVWSDEDAAICCAVGDGPPVGALQNLQWELPAAATAIALSEMKDFAAQWMICRRA